MTVRYRTCTNCQRNRAEKFYTPRGHVCLPCQKQRAARASKDRRLQSLYGITIEEFDALMEHQLGVCAVCGGKRRNFDLDHDHAIEKVHGPRASVRGIICRRDNKLLRDARDNPWLLRQLADYLEDPPAPEVLT